MNNRVRYQAIVSVFNNYTPKVRLNKPALIALAMNFFKEPYYYHACRFYDVHPEQALKKIQDDLETYLDRSRYFILTKGKGGGVSLTPKGEDLSFNKLLDDPENPDLLDVVADEYEEKGNLPMANKLHMEAHIIRHGQIVLDQSDKNYVLEQCSYLVKFAAPFYKSSSIGPYTPQLLDYIIVNEGDSKPFLKANYSAGPNYNIESYSPCVGEVHIYLHQQSKIRNNKE